jgi:hypothetical protein
MDKISPNVTCPPQIPNYGTLIIIGGERQGI